MILAASVPITRCWFCFNYFDEESGVTLKKEQTVTAAGMFFLGHHESLKCSSATWPLPVLLTLELPHGTRTFLFPQKSDVHLQGTSNKQLIFYPIVSKGFLGCFLLVH